MLPYQHQLLIITWKLSDRDGAHHYECNDHSSAIVIVQEKETDLIHFKRHNTNVIRLVGVFPPGMNGIQDLAFTIL